MMKSACVALCVCFVALVAAELTDEEKQQFAVTLAGCKDSTGATDDDIASIMKHEDDITHEGKCLKSCIMEHFGLISAEGKMIKEGALKAAHKFMDDAEKLELASGVIDACMDLEVSEDHCEAAHEYCTCMKTEAAAAGIELDL